ncbi:protein VASCULAR ASSOCIATED DEATH 1, chloroplastic-like [Coffea arabica]|uniref:Protein VASCULAR ASSOCIATED DEATH 1, chloroplastic-like n=1 Tax=Coffea arabica TaxID=13443 RepID=A0ABM4WWH4_COFAR
MAAVASEKVVEPSLTPSPALSMSRTPSRQVSNATASDPSFAETPDRPSSLDRSPSSSRQLVDSQNQLFLRSEEYRQLFRLPQDEVLIQDFNCALQENFLLQGHMYLFAHYICFYSNLFGFETRKIIPFNEVTSVRRAKAAAIFPTAIEIIAGEKKFFFTSFLSRDEAYKLINDGWSQNNRDIKSIADEQESTTGSNSLENGCAIVEKVESCRQSVDESNLIERDKDGLTPDDVVPQANGEPEIVSTSIQQQDIAENNVENVQNIDCSASGKSLAWELVDYDPPQVPEGFTMVADSKFPVTVEEFLEFFFSDQAVDFQDSFHRKCGDRDFKQTEWRPHEKSGYTRDVSFQHPIKIYFGAKFGSCQVVQQYRVYKNCHFILETSQEISDVPYADYFRVEGLWHVERDGDESKRGCILRVYVNVNFSKKTMWRGKIVQSTIEESREAYATWIDLAHQLLKQKNLEVKEGNLIQSNQAQGKKEERNVGSLEKSNEAVEANLSRALPISKDVYQHPIVPPGRGHPGSASVAPFSDLLVKFYSALKNQNPVSLFLVIGIAVILLLMQASILTLLSRPQQIHVVPQADWMYSINRGASESGGEIALLDKQITHLKEELHMVETLLDKMQHEHALLKLRLSDLERSRKRQK